MSLEEAAVVEATELPTELPPEALEAFEPLPSERTDEAERTEEGEAPR